MLYSFLSYDFPAPTNSLVDDVNRAYTVFNRGGPLLLGLSSPEPRLQLRHFDCTIDSPWYQIHCKRNCGRPVCFGQFTTSKNHRHCGLACPQRYETKRLPYPDHNLKTRNIELYLPTSPVAPASLAYMAGYTMNSIVQVRHYCLPRYESRGQELWPLR